MRSAHLALVALLGVAACNVNDYRLGGGDDTPDDGRVADDGRRGDGGDDLDAGADGPRPDACAAIVETCNQADDDCDGQVDEDFDTSSDPRHCGGCGQRCFQPNTAGTCAAGQCQYACLPGWVDRDNDPSNGCDYQCTPTNGGVESCDFVDNDCDGTPDDGLALDTDVNNCGQCGRVCLALHATPTCTAGQCGAGACDPGFADLLPLITGCEYQCPVFPTRAETCDNRDEDCDGVVDDGPLPMIGGTCTQPGLEALGDTGECTFGTVECRFGTSVCIGYQGPTSELCNDLDDDCDARTDETFDKQNDPRHCGSCNPCNLPHALAGCSAGACTVAICLPGFVDHDGQPGNGCEYACTASGPEVCDGVDNDCDMLVDQADPDLDAPANVCHTLGACAGTQPTCAADPCTGAIGWQCAYPAAAETDACGDLPAQETACDGIDGDCDGRVDESYPTKGGACADGGVGACRGTGTLACAPTGDALICTITNPGVPPAAERCDGVDNDCDGQLDEGAPDDMVTVDGPAGPFLIYAHEASRPDADADDFGSLAHRACSRPGVLPWRNVTWTEAEAACAAAGKRLCTEGEWQAACEGPTALLYPYGNAYDPGACNGRDNDPDCAAPDDDQVMPTGTPHGCPRPMTSRCVSPAGAFDLSGNLREWTSTAVGTSFRIRGGGFDNIRQGLTCDLSFIALAPTFAFPNLGFRCCADQP
jgi:hypothetical protein